MDMLHSSTTVQINLTILSILFHVSTVPSFSQIWVHFCGEIRTPATTRLLPRSNRPAPHVDARAKDGDVDQPKMKGGIIKHVH